VESTTSVSGRAAAARAGRTPANASSRVEASQSGWRQGRTG